jgi:hypothetical protein
VFGLIGTFRVPLGVPMHASCQVCQVARRGICLLVVWVVGNKVENCVLVLQNSGQLDSVCDCKWLPEPESPRTRFPSRHPLTQT